MLLTTQVGYVLRILGGARARTIGPVTGSWPARGKGPGAAALDAAGSGLPRFFLFFLLLLIFFARLPCDHDWEHSCPPAASHGQGHERVDYVVHDMWGGAVAGRPSREFYYILGIKDTASHPTFSFFFRAEEFMQSKPYHHI